MKKAQGGGECISHRFEPREVSERILASADISIAGNTDEVTVQLARCVEIHLGCTRSFSVNAEKSQD